MNQQPAGILLLVTRMFGVQAKAFASVPLRACVCVCAHIYIYIYVYVCVNMYLCMYVCMYVCM